MAALSARAPDEQTGYMVTTRPPRHRPDSSGSGGGAAWLERWQVPLYLASLALGAAVGYLWPAGALGFGTAINPVLMVLLYATFLGVPFARIRAAFADVRFMACVVVLNFVVVPLVVFALSRPVAFDPSLLVGVLLVLLCPCVDYVMVFTRLGGGDAGRLVAASPVQMLLQMVLLPLFLWLFAGGAVVAAIHWAPFARAFLLLIVVPLVLSVLTQQLARRQGAARVVMRAMESAMVPLMMGTLMVVVASQFVHVAAQFGLLVRVVPLFVGFLVVMPVLANLIGRLGGQPVVIRRTLAFTGSTRNSLVVLPLALALPPEMALAASVVVTQTLVELLGMVTFVRVIPRLIRQRPGPGRGAPGQDVRAIGG
ncbi:Bile acid:sodium symporter [Propionibacterium freudenreichii]|nr:Bile acid:sodium symporter [Propionibacterium freudenreichii]SCQ80124.1 Bile acid:sodium symporter [Propionibacterium freudenreichii]